MVRSHGIHLRALSLDDVKIPIDKIRVKIAVLKWHPGLPGANELTKPEHSGGNSAVDIFGRMFFNVFAILIQFHWDLFLYFKDV